MLFRSPHLLALGFLLRLRRTGWLTEQPGGFEQEARIAFTPELAPLLDGLDAIVHPPVVTYTGKLYKAWRLLAEIGSEAAPYENVLREVAADLAELNRSLRGLNASIGHYIDRLTPTKEANTAVPMALTAAMRMPDNEEEKNVVLSEESSMEVLTLKKENERLRRFVNKIGRAHV